MTKKKITKEESIEIIKCIDLRNIYVKSSNFKLDKTLLSKTGNEVIVKESFKLGINKKDYFEILCDFLVEVKNKDKIPILIQVLFCMEYSTTKKFNKKYLPYLVKSQILLTIIPYLREYVTQTSTRMGISPIILPLYKVIPQK